MTFLTIPVPQSPIIFPKLTEKNRIDIVSPLDPLFPSLFTYNIYNSYLRIYIYLLLHYLCTYNYHTHMYKHRIEDEGLLDMDDEILLRDTQAQNSLATYSENLIQKLACVC